uniref:Protein kinase domain-containing protein n=1 Tax=Nelumbo nucifera TaxID=4432 RepID=A0A822XY60_NELNU|nr:TPA_asm: hypothetical protein HUJ06_023791 [Nelumbo nucifera]
MDIKSLDVLDDGNWNAKLGDFGLALRGHVEDVKIRCTPPVDTLGYLNPSYVLPENLNTKSDCSKLTYYTGCGYLAKEGDTLKLCINRVLNASGHSSKKFGNRVGVIGLLYTGLESKIVAVRDTDDIINSVLAGLGTGALFKAASGPRSAAVAGDIGGSGSCMQPKSTGPVDTRKLGSSSYQVAQVRRKSGCKGIETHPCKSSYTWP